MPDLESFLAATGGPTVSPPLRRDSGDDHGSVDSANFLSVSDEEQSSEETEESPVPPLLEKELNLTAPVQDLLDKLNTISGKMNNCETQLSQLDSGKKALYANWNAQKKYLLESIGMHSIERTKPVFDAYEKQQLAQAAVNETTALFLQCVADCSEMKKALATAPHVNAKDVLKLSIEAQTKRDALEQANQERMAEFNDAQTELVNIRKTIGTKHIQKAWPWFEAYSNHKTAYEKIYNNINKLRSEMKALKANYRLCMAQLESISEKVHQIRNQDSSN